MEEHKPLIKEGKEWIKDRSNSCMLVATLIATITFAAAITLPGGNNADGMPQLLQEKKFLVFILSDAVAFFFSLTSILVFIANMNGSYTEEEFVIALPQRLLVGLACLFFAVIATMVAYIAAVSLFLEDRYSTSKIGIPPTVGIALFALLPITLSLELPIFSFGTEVYALLGGPFVTCFVVLVLLGVGAAW
ncbi:ankyrin repeat protein [Trifolium medium]|uniref:Ankyrin repeat protein n=1 Tax=Trifolium medium TaxID=97028 RepID=A0A392M0E5_9FABA|nr:ankyrin repeat protein [Trifolium medium]